MPPPVPRAKLLQKKLFGSNVGLNARIQAQLLQRLPRLQADRVVDLDVVVVDASARMAVQDAESDGEEITAPTVIVFALFRLEVRVAHEVGERETGGRRGAGRTGDGAM